MSNWRIRYRAESGVAEMHVQAATLEHVEAAFNEAMLEYGTFGAIIRIDPETLVG